MAGAAKGVDTELKKVGDNDGLSRAGASADQFKDKLEGVRNTGLALAAIGGVGMVIAEGFTKANLEADALGSKMAALLQGAGISEATGQVKQLADELAKAGEGDNDEIAKTLAEAIASGRIMSLKQYGIVLSETAKESVKAAQAVSEHAGKMELANQVALAGAAAVKTLRANSSDAALSIAEMDHRMSEAAEGIGAGTAKVKAALYSGILSPILDILEASPGLQETSGVILSIGSAGLSAGGSVFGLASQVGLTMMAFPGLAASGVSAFAAIGTSAAAAGVAIWAAIAPILPLVLAIAAVMAAITAGAVYLQKRAQAGAEAEGEATDREFYDTVKGKDGAQNGESFEDWRKRTGRTPDAMNADDTGDASNVNAALENARKVAAMPPQVPTMPAMPQMPAAVVPSVAPIVTAPVMPVNAIASTVAALPAGGGMAALMGKSGATTAGSKSAASGGTLQVGNPTYRQDSSGVWWAKFPDLRIPPSGLEAAFSSFGK